MVASMHPCLTAQKVPPALWMLSCNLTMRKLPPTDLSILDLSMNEGMTDRFLTLLLLKVKITPLESNMCGIPLFARNSSFCRFR